MPLGGPAVRGACMNKYPMNHNYLVHNKDMIKLM